MTVRLFLRLCREAEGSSARGLSLRAGLSDSVVSKIESGEIQPSLRAFARIVVQLGLNDHEIAWLVRTASTDNHRDPDR